MQHLRSLFWFSLTILSILSLTVFPLIKRRVSSYKPQISNKRRIISQSDQSKRRLLISASPPNAVFIRNLAII